MFQIEGTAFSEAQSSKRGSVSGHFILFHLARIWEQDQEVVREWELVMKGFECIAKEFTFFILQMKILSKEMM